MPGGQTTEPQEPIHGPDCRTPATLTDSWSHEHNPALELSRPGGEPDFPSEHALMDADGSFAALATATVAGISLYRLF